MKAGDRIAGRFEVLAEAPGEPDVARYRAIDAQTSEPVELLVLRRPPWRKASEEAAFADLHRRVARAAAVHIVRTLAVLDHEGRSVAVRQPLEDATLGAVKAPLDPRQVAAIGAQLVPTVLAAQSITGGALADEDIGIDATGAAVLAPRGRPVTRFGPRESRWVAPELFAGAGPDGASGLFGLGVALYRLATGRDPALGAAGIPPTPSSIRRGIPPELDEALLRLLSPEPMRRAGALPLLQESAAPAIDLRTALVPTRAMAPATATTGEVQLTHRTERRVVTRHADFGAAVAVPARLVLSLEPAQRSAVAGLTRLSEKAVEQLALQGLPLVIETTRSRSVAKQRAAELRSQTGLPVRAVSSAGCAPLALAGLAIATSPIGLLLLAFGQIGLVATWGAATLLLVIAAAVWAAMARRQLGAARRAWRVTETSREPEMPEIARTRDRIAALRRRVAESDLPSAAALDLRTGLRDLEDQLEGLVGIATMASRTLEQLDRGQLETRMAVLARTNDGKAVRERDRVARALTDLDEVAARKERARAEIALVDASLDELAAALGRTGAPVESERAERVVDRLTRDVRLARESLEDVESVEKRRPIGDRE